MQDEQLNGQNSWSLSKAGYAVITATLCFALAQSLYSQNIFQKRYDLGFDVTARHIDQTADSGFIVTGDTPNDLFLMKLDKVGSTQWFKTYGGSNNDEGWYVQQTTDGGFVLTGNTYSFGAGLSDIYLIRTNNSGDTLWTKVYGGTDKDYGWCVRETSDSGFIIAGSSRYDGGATLIKTDQNGDTLWTKKYSGGFDYFNSVRQTTDDGYILCGLTSVFGFGGPDVYLMKTDSLGDTLWTKTYGGIFQEYGYVALPTNDGGYIVGGGIGGFNPYYYLIKTDSNGDSLWTKIYGGNNEDPLHALEIMPDNGYLMAGWTNSFQPQSDYFYVIRTDVNGDTLWSRIYGSTEWLEREHCYGMTLTLDGGFALIGDYQDIFNGRDYVYIVKADANGKSGCNELMPNTEKVNFFKAISSGANIVRGLIVTDTTCTVGSDIPIDTTLCSGVGIEEMQSLTDHINMFPNPSSGIFTVAGEGKITVYDLLGNAVLTEPNKREIDLSAFPAGIYLVRLGERTEKVVLSK